jgi:hypothetical protein
MNRAKFTITVVGYTDLNPEHYADGSTVQEMIDANTNDITQEIHSASYFFLEQPEIKVISELLP